MCARTHTQVYGFFPQTFESKLQASCLFAPKYFSVFPRHKGDLLENRSTVIKTRKLHIDTILIHIHTLPALPTLSLAVLLPACPGSHAAFGHLPLSCSCDRPPTFLSLHDIHNLEFTERLLVWVGLMFPEDLGEASVADHIRRDISVPKFLGRVVHSRPR